MTFWKRGYLLIFYLKDAILFSFTSCQERAMSWFGFLFTGSWLSKRWTNDSIARIPRHSGPLSLTNRRRRLPLSPVRLSAKTRPRMQVKTKLRSRWRWRRLSRPRRRAAASRVERASFFERRNQTEPHDLRAGVQPCGNIMKRKDHDVGRHLRAL